MTSWLQIFAIRAQPSYVTFYKTSGTLGKKIEARWGTIHGGWYLITESMLHTQETPLSERPCSGSAQ